jgi:VanZ family protein
LAVLVTTGWAGFLTFIATNPHPPAPSSPPLLGLSWAFAAHFGGYFVLAFLLTLVLEAVRGGHRAKLWIPAASGTVAALHGGVMEVAQLWIPGRFASVQDGLVNLLGAAIGALLAWWLIAAARSLLTRRAT